MASPPSSQAEIPTKTEGAEATFSAVAQAYAARRAELLQEETELERRSGRASILRGLTFLAAGALTAYAVLRTAPASRALVIAAAAFGALFIALVVAHALLVTREDTLKKRVRLVEEAIARVSARPKRSAAASTKAEGAEAAPPAVKEARVSKSAVAPPDHPYAKDLDIFSDRERGRERSLFELIDMTQTEPGESTLASWLAAPAPPEEIATRQGAVLELAPLTRFREDLALEGVRAETRGRPVAPLVAWAEGPLVLAGGADADPAKNTAPPRRLTLIGAGALVAATFVLFALDQALGVKGLGHFHRAWVVTLALQLGILGSLNKGLAPLLSAASSKQAPFGRYRALFEHVEKQSFQAVRLAARVETLRGARGGSGASGEQTGGEASAAMRSLETIIGYAELRNSGFVYLFINAFLLWDVWCALALDRWRARAGRRVRGWFAALGDVEALASLATFAYERPDHTFPTVTEGPTSFEATGLGHPMLPPDVRVANSVSFAEPGQSLLITGSNMSGKSTLLRAIGVNAVLAQAGAPVCAARLRMSPLAVRTSMRIDDSLEQGISHFYAELSRLKSIVDSADAGAKVLFLLDEILHGTNSRERHIGAKAVVLHLLDRGAIGALSSHDLALADMAEASGGRVRIVHFEEIIRGGRMAFDYTLKPGVVTTTNALRLMRLVGLDIPTTSDEAGAGSSGADGGGRGQPNA